VFCLAGVFFFSTIPEVTDADMAQSAEETHGGTDLAGEKPFRKQYRLFHAAFAQFCYVGSQGMRQNETITCRHPRIPLTCLCSRHCGLLHQLRDRSQARHQ
jgi:hypothetical protein